MNGTNVVHLVGYVGQDIKSEKFEKGYRVALRVATHHFFTDPAGQRINLTTWHNITAWDQTAEFASRNFVKGSKIMVEGRLVYHCYRGGDGVLRVATHIVAVSLLNLDR